MPATKLCIMSVQCYRTQKTIPNNWSESVTLAMTLSTLFTPMTQHFWKPSIQTAFEVNLHVSSKKKIPSIPRPFFFTFNSNNNSKSSAIKSFRQCSCQEIQNKSSPMCVCLLNVKSMLGLWHELLK